MSFGEDIVALVAANGYGALAAGQGWPRVPLGEVAQIINGFAFESKFFNSNSGLPLVRIRDVVGGGSDTYYSGPVPDGYRVENGDILVGMDGDFNSAFWRGGLAVLNQRVCKIVTDENRLRRRYLAYALPAYLKLINDHTSSVTVKHLSSRTLQAIPLPLPAPGIQDALVARIDALFAEIDEGERALAAAREGVETYRKSLLKAAVTGELTADWRRANPAAETGEDLLRRILVERRVRWDDDPKSHGKRYVEPTGPRTEGLPILPDRWAWASLRQLTATIRNGVSLKPSGEPNGLPILRISAVRPMKVDALDLRRLRRAFDATGYWVEPGDLLITRYNGSPDLVGVCGRYRGSVPVVHPDKLIRLVLASSDDDLSDFVEMATNVGATRRFIESNTKTTAGQHGVSGETVGDAPVPIPPLDEAVVIAGRVRRSLAAISALQAEVFQGSDPASLRQSILAAAFRGELGA